MPNLPVDVNSWGRSACYPQGSFYPLSDGISTHYHLITNSYFRTCSTCWSRSQPGFYVYTHCAISVRAEPSFERLRYSFGGDRPSQTAHLTMSPSQIHGCRLESQYFKSGIPRVTPPTLACWFPSLPPILYIKYRDPISGYSEAPWGLPVLPRVTGIFTGTTISPGALLRQCPDHYTIRAGRNLPDKEFRYLRTVIVTAAVYWGFNSELAPLLLTFQHRAGVTPYTSSYDLAESCVFDKQLPGPIHCGSLA